MSNQKENNEMHKMVELHKKFFDQQRNEYSDYGSEQSRS